MKKTRTAMRVARDSFDPQRSANGGGRNWKRAWARYLSQLDTADHQLPSVALAIKTEHLKEKLAKLKPGKKMQASTEER